MKRTILAALLIVSLLAAPYSNMLFIGRAESYVPPQSGRSLTIQDNEFSYASDAKRLYDETAIDISSASLNNDTDFPELFSPNGYGTVAENNSPLGLKTANSLKSIKFTTAGYGFPTLTISGSTTGIKSIRLWVLVKPNEYTHSGFSGPAIPISNMTTGATLATVVLEQWVQVTINVSDMTGKSFGLLQDRAPLSSAGSLDFYFDNVEFLDYNNQIISRLGHIGNSKEVYYSNSNFSFLGYGKSYDVYFRIKAEKTSLSTGNAFQIGLFDATQGIERMSSRKISVSEFVNNQWYEYRLGTFKPDNNTNEFQFYVQGVGNLEVTNLYIDYIVFKEVVVSVQDSDFTYTNGAARVADSTAIDGYAASLNADKDYPELFSVSSYMSLYENTDVVGLKDSESYRSIKLNLAGWGNLYPTVTVEGDLTNKKAIRLWVLVKPNAYSAPGFSGTDIPISSMSTGATLATATLNQWVQITINFSDMGSGKKFGFLYDRAPLEAAGSLTVYFDKIEFLDNNNQIASGVAGNIGLEKGIAYETNSISFLKNSVSYDVYFRIKAEKTDAATGDAFKIGILDKSQNRELVDAKIVSASEILNHQWLDFKLSSFTPFYATNQLQFYVQGVGNVEIKNLYIDYIAFKEAYTEIPDYNFTYANGSARVKDSTATDGFAASLNSDKDYPELFSVSSYMSLSENTEADGLKDNESYRSIKLNLAGWGNLYSTVTVEGDLTGKKSVRFWVLAKPNDYTTPGFSGPDIPISNMVTGATLATATLNQWVQITINFSDMSSGKTFGFLYDRAPLNTAGSLNIYFDKIEFLDNDNQSVSFTAGNIGNSKSVTYEKWDFSWMFKYGTAYDVYFRVKAEKTAAASGAAFRFGVFDETQSKDIITPKTVMTSEFNSSQWYEYKIGTLKPNYGVNKLQFYAEGVGNTEIKDLYIDCLMFVECTSTYIENKEFKLNFNATNVTEGRAADNSATRVYNGKQTTSPAAQILIDGAKYIPGDYSLTLSISPDRTSGANWDNTIGDILAVEVKNLTTGGVYLSKLTYTTSNSVFQYKLNQFYMLVYQFLIVPTDDYVINLYAVDNSVNFSSYVIDNLKISRIMPEDYYDSQTPLNNVSPYKISPGQADGINDFANITYTLNGIYEQGKTIDVTVYDENGWVVKQLVDNRDDSGNQKVIWNGTDYAGNVVLNGLYTIEVKRSDGLILLRKNVQVQTGVVLGSALTNPANNYFPQGVWFEAAEIPSYPEAASTYLDRCFSDIKDANCNTVYMANWENSASDYSIVLKKAKEYGLYIVGLPGSNSLFKFWGGDFWDSEAYYINDEWELYNRVEELTKNITEDPNASQNIGYLLFDEPRSMYLKDKEEFGNHLSVMRRMLEGIDPDRFTIIDYTMPEDASYFYHDNKTQALSIDIYPCSPYYNTPGNFKHIGNYPNAEYEKSLDVCTLQVREELTNEAPLWPIIQTHETGAIFRNPLPSEVRAMTYEAIGRGAKGMTYFMYQSTLEWNGMVDNNYDRRPEDFDTVKQLNSEINTLKDTILDMRRIANVATATGGGGGATTSPYDPGYASADVTTHESVSSGDAYIVAVNHNCVVSDNVAININRSKLGFDISEIKLISSIDGSESNVLFTKTASGYTLSNINFAPGDGKIFRLVRNNSKIVKTIEDSAFSVTNSEALRGVADISADNGQTAVKVSDNSNSQWDFCAYLSSAGLVLNTEYDVYARLKIKYKTDMLATERDGPSFPLPGGNAVTVGIKNSSGTNIVSSTVIAANTMENMLWTNIKIGTASFTGTQLTGTNAFVYVNPANNMNNVEIIYVDQIYFVDKNSGIEGYISVSNIVLDQTDISTYVGGVCQLNYQIEPQHATDKRVYFYSDDTNVTVSDVGEIMAVSIGTGQIKAKSFDGSKIAVCKVTVKNAAITSSILAVSESKGLIGNVVCGTSINNLLSMLDSSEHIIVTQGSGNPVPENSFVGTGMKLSRVKDGQTFYTLSAVVTGDLNGDSQMNLLDIVKLKNGLLIKDTLKGVFEAAGDLDQDGSLTIQDLLNLKNKIINIT